MFFLPSVSLPKGKATNGTHTLLQWTTVVPFLFVFVLRAKCPLRRRTIQTHVSEKLPDLGSAKFSYSQMHVLRAAHSHGAHGHCKFGWSPANQNHKPIRVSYWYLFIKDYYLIVNYFKSLNHSLLSPLVKEDPWLTHFKMGREDKSTWKTNYFMRLLVSIVVSSFT